MKITMNIDDSLLTRVMKLSGSRTKTAAVDYALREVERREIEKRLEGSVFFPGYDVMAARIAEKEARYGGGPD